MREVGRRTYVAQAHKEHVDLVRHDAPSNKEAMRNLIKCYKFVEIESEGYEQ